MSVEYPWTVKFYIDEDGQKVDKPAWHMVHDVSGSNASLCGGQVFGYGEGRLENEFGLDYEERKGRVTCEECREIIKTMKGVKL